MYPLSLKQARSNIAAIDYFSGFSAKFKSLCRNSSIKKDTSFYQAVLNHHGYRNCAVCQKFCLCAIWSIRPMGLCLLHTIYEPKHSVQPTLLLRTTTGCMLHCIAKLWSKCSVIYWTGWNAVLQGHNAHRTGFARPDWLRHIWCIQFYKIAHCTVESVDKVLLGKEVTFRNLATWVLCI